MNDIKEVTNLMEEARRRGVPVLGPDVNESSFKFTVNKEGAIRFGLGAMRGVSEGAVMAIVDGREDEGYKSLFENARRVNLKTATNGCLRRWRWGWVRWVWASSRPVLCPGPQGTALD